MAVLITADIPGGTEQQDQEMMRAMNVAATPPKGVICRAGAAIPGGWRIFSLWESREAFEAFYKNQVQTTGSRMGMLPTRIEVMEVTNVNVPQQALAAVR